MARTIHKDMSISEALRLYPEVEGVFVRHGMGCMGCIGALDETVAIGTRMHGLDVEQLVAELKLAVLRSEADKG